MNLQTSVLEYIEDVKNNSASCEEFMAKTIEHIKKIDTQINAHISVFEDAISSAREIDVKIKSGKPVGACYGMPVSIKDNMCISGKKTTCASKMLERFISPYDATVIQKLNDSDAIITGKTNMDEFGMGSTTEFSSYGHTCNPSCKLLLRGRILKFQHKTLVCYTCRLIARCSKSPYIRSNDSDILPSLPAFT